MFLTKFRKHIDAHAPLLGRAYRSLLDLSVNRKARPTSYGFELAGSVWAARENYEREQVEVFLRLLDSHDVVLDIGANIGFYSCLAASRNKHVISFEPLPKNFSYLCKNLWNNNLSSNAEVFPLGLAKQSGLTPIYGSGTIASLTPGWGQAQESRFILVPVAALDFLVGRFCGKKLLIKMDVEGFELDVLAGATATLDLAPKPTWLVEILLRHEVIPGGINKRFLETFGLFWKHGYQSRTLDDRCARIEQEHVLRWIEQGSADCENFMFFAP